MAKHIKTIKCPNCGSVKVTLLKTDYYQCKSCGTEFYLDSDDININHNYNYNYNSSPTANSANIRKAVAIIIGFVLLIALVSLLGAIFSKPKTTAYNTYSADKSDNDKGKFSWYTSTETVFVDDKGNPYYVITGLTRPEQYSRDEDKSMYIALYDAKTSKQKWIKKLSTGPYEITSRINYRVFDDGNLYILLGEKEVYRLNAKKLNIENVKELYEKTDSALTIGMAKIEFLYENYGSGYKLVTNDGKTLWYMPLINKTYTENEFRKATESPLPSAILKTAYSFSSVSDDYPEEKPALVKYQYKFELGYPRDEPRFEWEKEYTRSGIFVGDAPHKKSFVTDWSREKSRLVDYKIFTADRNYFSPNVIDFDSTRVLISFKPTPADDETLLVQIINGETGAIIKSIHTQSKYLSAGLLTKDGFILFDNPGAQYYDASGQMKNEIEANKLKFDKN